ncbi:DUF4468 domain-containing protein [Spirosoma flavum]|uniref:DUF4468 domain-containing protein n=1 Tax=Spirosoma flavum TaxID=2048557 RepID=A0ABW6AP47_9BACT
MKNNILLLFLTWSLSSSMVFGQKMPIENGKLGGILPIGENGKAIIQVVEPVSGSNKSALFQRARRWFVQSYGSANKVLQLNDSLTGELSGRATFVINPTMIGVPVKTQIDHLITVEIKDGRYRATVTDFFMTAKTIVGPIESIKGTSKGFLIKVYTMIDEESLALLKSLKTAMSTEKSDF